ncbi:MAG: type II secretion system GspH family protein [Betaproteobacteria bacterium]|nr:type II secretion system GspH family protein [Betaproteobacteria bacterium]
MKRSIGFTLIEMAVAVFIIALLLGSILVPLSTQVKQRNVSDTQKSLEEIKEALMGFAIASGYLPCPAISATNGQEDRTAGVCTGGKRQGFIPWETLGVAKIDAWGHIFRYSVTPAYASSAAPFTLATASDITIQTRNSAGALTNLTSANSVPAVVLSHGANGYGSTNNQGTVQAVPPTWPGSFPDENTNATGSTTFVSRAEQAAGASGAGGEFDDSVSWVARFALYNRMVAAGKLP